MLQSDQPSQESQKIGPDRPKEIYEDESGLEVGPNGNHHVKHQPTKKTNLNELFITVLTTLNPTSHTAMALVSSVMKAKRAARQKVNK